MKRATSPINPINEAGSSGAVIIFDAAPLAASATRRCAAPPLSPRVKSEPSWLGCRILACRAATSGQPVDECKL